jgi:hypothetical protein
MSDILQDFSPPVVAHAIDSSHIAYQSLFSTLPGAERYDEGGVRCISLLGCLMANLLPRLHFSLARAWQPSIMSSHCLKYEGTIGGMMTLMAAREARDAGYRIGVLTASPMGINIYRRLGFRKYGTLSWYHWHPINNK